MSRRSWLEFEALVVEQVREIPRGSVATYGDIYRRAPRRVGFVLATTREEVPWYRVVRSDGTPALGERQLALLRKEGVPIRGHRVDLDRARGPAFADREARSPKVGRRGSGRSAPRVPRSVGE